MPPSKITIICSFEDMKKMKKECYFHSLPNFTYYFSTLRWTHQKQNVCLETELTSETCRLLMKFSVPTISPEYRTEGISTAKQYDQRFRHFRRLIQRIYKHTMYSSENSSQWDLNRMTGNEYF